MADRRATVDEFHEAQAQAMREQELQDRYIIPAAKRLGWRVYHTYDSRRSQEGFPDLVLAHAEQGRVIFAELKSEKGRLNEHQVAWLRDLSQVVGNIETRVWRPRDWVRGDVQRELMED